MERGPAALQLVEQRVGAAAAELGGLERQHDDDGTLRLALLQRAHRVVGGVQQVCAVDGARAVLRRNCRTPFRALDASRVVDERDVLGDADERDLAVAGEPLDELTGTFTNVAEARTRVVDQEAMVSGAVAAWTVTTGFTAPSSRTLMSTGASLGREYRPCRRP